MNSETTKLFIEIILKVIGGLGIFLLGMKHMSEGMQAVAGERLRKLISSVTDNRFMACGVGTAMTCLVQSSSVTTVMVVGLVNAGFMTLMQAIGVIFGANVGTTITGWILVLNIGKYGLPMLGVCALIYLFARKDKVRYIAMALMGIGMVFFGLELMSGGFKPLRGMPEFVAWFSKFSADNYLGIFKCVLTGCIVTMIVQSSSATLGITIGLAINGIISFPTAAALVLGENIGTTVTAKLASIGANTNARRAANAHMIFNVLGVLWISILFPWYIKIIESFIGFDPHAVVVLDEGYQLMVRKGIALTHSGFNIANTLLFLPLLPIVAKVVTWMVPEDKSKEIPHLTFLDIRMLDTPAIGIQESQNQIVRMGELNEEMMDQLKEVLEAEEVDQKKVEKIFRKEEILDVMQKEITEFLNSLLAGNIPGDVVERARMQLRAADEYESFSDYLSNILKLFLKKKKSGIWFAKEGWKEVLSLHDKVREYAELINDGVRENRPSILTKARTMGDAITYEMKQSRRNHLERIEQGEAKPLESLIFTDMLNAYRRAKDHGLNIAEALAGEK